MTGRQTNYRALLLGGFLSLVLPAAGTLCSVLFWQDVEWRLIPLHSVVETIGGLMALAVAGILRSEYSRRDDVGHYPWMAGSLLAMGVLDLLHASVPSGNVFVWLHSTATFFGGALFATVWAARRQETRKQIIALPWVALLAGLAVGITGMSFPGGVPMMAVDGRFTPAARILNIAGGIGFWIATVYFLRRFLRHSQREDWLFAVHTALFGAAGVLFEFSALWDPAWWCWHVLRLLAYLAALVFALGTYLDSEAMLRTLNQQLEEMNRSLDRTIEERTASLKASEERFELAIRGTSAGIWDWNVLTDEVYYAPRFKELLGFQPDEFPHVFASFERRLHPEDREPTLEALQAHLRHRAPYDVHYRLRTKSGAYRWFRARGEAIWNEHGVATRMAGSIADITEERRLQERFRLAVDASPTALLVVDEAGTITLANPASAQLFGYPRDELVGQPVELLVPDEMREGHVFHRQAFLRDPSLRPMRADLNLFARRKDGERFPVRVGLGPMKTDQGTMVICGIEDISDQRRAIEALEEAKEAAELASHAKSSFLANMSHEIRTPMNGIIGMAHLLSHTELASHQREYLNTISESAHVLLHLLNDILDFSKIEAGKLELECIDFELSEYVRRATHMLSLRAAEKGLEVACRVSPNIPNRLVGDPGRLQQVLVNLIGNAVKFTEEGEIVIDIDEQCRDAQSVTLHISVRDTGIGIPPEKQSNIFSAFEQAESSTTRRFGGTGLGLAISRQLVEMMGGRLCLESEEGRGSTFSFSATFGISTSEPRSPPVSLESLDGLRVLVVDDNETNRRILCELLQHWRMQPILANDAPSARRILAHQDPSDRPIQLLLVDNAMPHETGLELVESIRRSPWGTELPILMIASTGDPKELERSRQLSVARWLSKPVIATDLLNEILHLFAAAPSIPERDAPPEEPPPSVAPLRVLLVEDNEINQRVAIGLLEAQGHQYVLAEDGQQALDILEQQEFDVVLMDVQMPVVDGYEATRTIRERERTTGGHIPIVAMTAEALVGDRERCLEAGMDDYISKPITAAALYQALSRVPAICLNVRGNDSPSRAGQVGEALSLSSADSSPVDAEAAADILAWDVMRERIPGGERMIRELADIFCRNSSAWLTEIEEALEARDADRLRRAAHTLKGAAGYFGAESVVESSRMIETHGRESRFEPVAEELRQLRRETTRLRDALLAIVARDL